MICAAAAMQGCSSPLLWPLDHSTSSQCYTCSYSLIAGGSVAEWLARWTQFRAQKLGNEYGKTLPFTLICSGGGSAAEWLACWTQAQKARVQIAVATLSGNSLRQTVHTHCASVHHAPKLVAALLRVARVTAGLTKSNGSPPPGL